MRCRKSYSSMYCRQRGDYMTTRDRQGQSPAPSSEGYELMLSLPSEPVSEPMFPKTILTLECPHILQALVDRYCASDCPTLSDSAGKHAALIAAIEFWLSLFDDWAMPRDDRDFLRKTTQFTFVRPFGPHWGQLCHRCGKLGINTKVACEYAFQCWVNYILKKKR